jgi:hypothetical protein
MSSVAGASGGGTREPSSRISLREASSSQHCHNRGDAEPLNAVDRLRIRDQNPPR